jgi:hypothetical protein
MEEGKRSFLDRKSICGGGFGRYVLFGLSVPGAALASKSPCIVGVIYAIPGFYFFPLIRLCGATAFQANRPPRVPPRNPSFTSPIPLLSSPATPYNRPIAASRNSSTSLLLTPSDSTTSLPGTGRPSNGLGLRQTSAQRTRPAVVPDPLEVLNGIIGKEKQEKDIPQLSSVLDRPTELVEIINF